MYITLQTTKRNLGLFNLEIKDIIVACAFALAFIILFSLEFYQTGLIVLSLGVFSLVPVSFSKQNRMYKLTILVIRFLLRKKTFYYHKDNYLERSDSYFSYLKKDKRGQNTKKGTKNYK